MKKYIGILIISFFCISFVHASTNTFPRTKENNYGVQKHREMNEKRIKKALDTPSVDEKEKIYDYSEILTEEEEEEILKLFLEYKEKTGFDIVFVSNSIPYTNDSVNEDYAADFYDYNNFGIENAYYSGVILFRNTYQEDPYYGIYYFGEAQLYYTGERNETILDTLYPNFRYGNYFEGVTSFVYSLSSYYDKGIESKYKNYYIDKNGYLVKKYKVPIILASGISLLLTFIVLSILIAKNKMVKKEALASLYLNKDSVFITNRKDQFLHAHVSHYTISSSSGSGFSGGSHGGSSGGGHSGGGRHG